MLRVNQLSSFGKRRGGGAPTTITQVDSATSTASTITVPASVIAGDLLVLLDLAFGSAPVANVPTDFLTINNLSDGSNARQLVSYKLADGSEASASLTGISTAGNTFRKSLYVMRGNSPALLATLAGVNSEFTSGNPSAQNVTASGGTPPLVVFGCYGCPAQTIDPRTMSPAKDGEISPQVSSYLAYKIYNSSPADVSVDMDDEGVANFLQSFYISLA
jgi:hypothetical protein